MGLISRRSLRNLSSFLAALLLFPVFAEADGITSGPTEINTSTYDGLGCVIKTDSDTVRHFFRSASSSGYVSGSSIKLQSFDISDSTWGTATDIYTDPDADLEVRDVCGGVIGSSIYLFFARRSDANTFVDIGFIKSTDLTGASWSSYTVVFDTSGLRFNVHGAMMDTDATTTFLQTFFHHTNGVDFQDKVFRTTDSGSNWSVYTTVADTATDWGEPACAFAGSGRIFCLLRDNDGGFMGQVTSTDNGATWSSPAATAIGDASAVKVPFAFAERDTNTALALFTDRTGTGPLLLSVTPIPDVMSSPSNWTATVQLDTGLTALGYPSMVSIGLGEYLIVYSKEKSGADADIQWLIYEVTQTSLSTTGLTLNGVTLN